MRLAAATIILLSVVMVVSGVCGPADGPRVCIEYVNGYRWPIHVYLNGTVRQLKETIQRRSANKVPPNSQTLKFDNQTLDDNQTLEHYKIQPHSLLFLEFAPGYEKSQTYFFDSVRRKRAEGPKPAKVYVDIPGYDSFDIEVDLTDTAEELKKRIFKQEEYPILEQEIRFEGSPLSGNKTLESYGIASSSTLKLQVPLTWCYQNPSGEPV